MPRGSSTRIGERSSHAASNGCPPSCFCLLLGDRERASELITRPAQRSAKRAIRPISHPSFGSETEVTAGKNVDATIHLEVGACAFEMGFRCRAASLSVCTEHGVKASTYCAVLYIHSPYSTTRDASRYLVVCMGSWSRFQWRPASVTISSFHQYARKSGTLPRSLDCSLWTAQWDSRKQADTKCLEAAVKT